MLVENRLQRPPTPAASHTGGFKPLSVENLKGETVDPHLKSPAGLIAVTGKGGKKRVVPIPIDLYRELESHVRENGELTVHQGLYRSQLQDATIQTGQRYAERGSHGLRWNYSQGITDTLLAMGYPAEQAMLVAQQRLGLMIYSIRGCTIGGGETARTPVPIEVLGVIP